MNKTEALREIIVVAILLAIVLVISLYLLPHCSWIAGR